MKITNFKFANQTLKSFGFMVCNFDKNGIQTNSNGSEIEFKTTPLFNGKQQFLTSATYKQPLSATICICPAPDCENHTDTTFVTVEQERQIMRWLNRKKFEKFEILDDNDYTDIYFTGSFNVEKVEFDNRLIGFKLNFTTDRPFAYKERNFIITFAQANTEYEVLDTSDEIGSLYLNVEIDLPNSISTDELIITHRFNSQTETIIIKGCTAGETIWLYYPMSTSNLSTHKFSRDFNYRFPKMTNNYSRNQNYFSCNIANVEMHCSYSPIVKIGI